MGILQGRISSDNTGSHELGSETSVHFDAITAGNHDCLFLECFSS